MAQDYDVEKIKKQIGETGTSLDQRFNACGQWAQGKFRRAQYNLRDFTAIPTTEDEKELVNEMAIGRFYHLENGDKEAEDQALKSLEDYILERYGRPQMRTRGGV